MHDVDRLLAPGGDHHLPGLDLRHVDLDRRTERARALLGEAGFDPVYGARPLKRAIQQQIENPLAERILGGSFGPGDRIVVDAGEGGLLFEKRAA